MAINSFEPRNKQPNTTSEDALWVALTQEPVSFFGGILAGFLALDIDQGKRFKTL